MSVSIAIIEESIPFSYIFNSNHNSCMHCALILPNYIVAVNILIHYVCINYIGMHFI